MGFFRLLKSSIYDPGFYGRVAEKKPFSAFGYFALLMLVSALALSVGPIREFSALMFQSSEEKEQLIPWIQNIYPEELSVTIDKGVVSTNVEEPYGIPFPEVENPGESSSEEYPDYLLVIDTENPISEAGFREYGTMVILGKDSIGFYDSEKGKVEIQNLKDFGDETLVVNKDSYDSIVAIALKWLKYIGVALLFLIPIFIFLSLVAFNLIYLLFGALVVWIVASIRGADWGYGTAYKASLYLITVPMAYHVLAAYVPKLDIFLVFTIILAGVTAINIAKKSASPESEAAPAIMETPTPETV